MILAGSTSESHHFTTNTSWKRQRDHWNFTTNTSWKRQTRVTTSPPTLAGSASESHYQPAHHSQKTSRRPSGHVLHPHPAKIATPTRENRHGRWFRREPSATLIGSHVISPSPATRAENRTRFGSDSRSRVKLVYPCELHHTTLAGSASESHYQPAHHSQKASRRPSGHVLHPHPAKIATPTRENRHPADGSDRNHRRNPHRLPLHFTLASNPRGE